MRPKFFCGAILYSENFTLKNSLNQFVQVLSNQQEELQIPKQGSKRNQIEIEVCVVAFKLINQLVSLSIFYC